MLKSDVFSHVLNFVDKEMQIEARMLNKKVASTVIAKMFNESEFGRLTIDLEESYSEKSHPLL